MALKIAVIGGGSTYTPELVEGLIRRAEDLGLEEVCLHDIDHRRLEVVGGLARRMVKRSGASFEIRQVEKRCSALSGASFVLNQIRVGGQEARDLDSRLCLERGVIGQETTGAAGFAKALRTIPVVMDICADMREVAPEAWLVNFTNPAGIVTEAVLKYGGVRVVGLCNYPIGVQMRIARDYGVEPSRVNLDYVGLNHLSWIRRILVEGRDVTREVLEKSLDPPANIPDELDYSPTFLLSLGMLPNSYLRYFYLAPEMYASLRGRGRTRGQEVKEIEERLLRRYGDPGLDEKPEELSERGGAHYSTVALSVISSLITDDQRTHIVNTANGSALPELPEEAAVEVPARIGADGVRPLACGRLEPEIRGLIQQVKAYEELTVEAAVRADRRLALMALAGNPLVPSVNKARELLDEFNRRHGFGLEP